jgi:hypothetical protein
MKLYRVYTDKTRSTEEFIDDLLKLKTKTKLCGAKRKAPASELYRLNDRRLSAKLVQTFADRGCRVDSATDPPAVNSVFLTTAATFSFK